MVSLEVARRSSVILFYRGLSCFVRIPFVRSPSLRRFHTRTDIILYPFVLINSIYNKRVRAILGDTSQSKPFLYKHPLYSSIHEQSFLTGREQSSVEIHRRRRQVRRNSRAS